MDREPDRVRSSASGQEQRLERQAHQPGADQSHLQHQTNEESQNFQLPHWLPQRDRPVNLKLERRETKGSTSARFRYAVLPHGLFERLPTQRRAHAPAICLQ